MPTRGRGTWRSHGSTFGLNLNRKPIWASDAAPDQPAMIQHVLRVARFRASERPTAHELGHPALFFIGQVLSLHFHHAAGKCGIDALGRKLTRRRRIRRAVRRGRVSSSCRVWKTPNPDSVPDERQGYCACAARTSIAGSSHHLMICDLMICDLTLRKISFR